ncbi:MAG: hypothetical protein K2W85_10345 [Phycisphaerales bacterium]|nr:hypothetical protein [Phycisphaerales bacterium]
MLSNIRMLMKSMVMGVVIAGALLSTTTSALADKIHLKDGRVIEGKVVREGQGFVFFRVKTGTVEREEMFTTDQILKIEREDATPKTDENLKKEEEAKKPEAKTDANKHTGATRVAVLNFGPPSDWQGSVGSTVGLEISVKAFRDAIPLLKKANAEIVVIRINSGGGLSLEMPKFQDLFEYEYKPNFRTVGWVESAISAAAMSPWTIEEYYFFTRGNMGACTEFSGRLNASKGMRLESVLAQMEKASIKGKKDFRIMRSMQIQEPLSVDFDKATGEVIWRQDENGELVLNRKDEVFTINASQAVKTKFAKGIADTREELAKAMDLQEVEWVAPEASAMIDKSLRENDATSKRFNEIATKYQEAVQLAASLQDKERRGQMIAQARRFLNELKTAVGRNPNFPLMYGTDDEWFAEQEELLRNLAKGP